jgi:hypothetical protein
VYCVSRSSKAMLLMKPQAGQTASRMAPVWKPSASSRLPTSSTLLTGTSSTS